MIYLLVGPDRYLLERELKRILSEIDPDNLNTTRYDKSSSIGEVSSRRRHRRLLRRGPRDRGRGRDGARITGPARRKKAEAEEIEALLLQSVAPGNTLILVDPDLGTIPAAVKKAGRIRCDPFGGRVPRGPISSNGCTIAGRAQGGHIERRNVAANS